MALSIAQETEVADFDKALRQQVQAEAPNKFPEFQAHHLAFGPVGIISPRKRYGLFVQGQQPLGANRHAVGVA
jgi:hypothetical protein